MPGGFVKHRGRANDRGAGQRYRLPKAARQWPMAGAKRELIGKA